MRRLLIMLMTQRDVTLQSREQRAGLFAARGEAVIGIFQGDFRFSSPFFARWVGSPAFQLRRRKHRVINGG